MVTCDVGQFLAVFGSFSSSSFLSNKFEELTWQDSSLLCVCVCRYGGLLVRFTDYFALHFGTVGTRMFGTESVFVCLGVELSFFL